MSVRTDLTDEEIMALPDEGVVYEIINGEVVTMTPAGRRHGRVAANITGMLWSYALSSGGRVYTAETAFWLTPTMLRVPDVAYIANPPPPDEEPEGFPEGAPDLAVEVISPSERAKDVEEKVALYLTAGARQVWTVYPETKTIVVHTPDDTARRYRPGATLPGGDLLPGLTLIVTDIFK